MSVFQVCIAILAAVALFLYGLTSFSREVQAAGGAALKSWLGRATRRWWAAFGLGAGVTLVIQSSSATTSLTVALVDAGVVSFTNSLPVMLGAKLGTTATAWLVSLKFTGIGAFFIVGGTVLGLLPVKWHVFGKVVFYFGFIFFSLDLIGSALTPLKESGMLEQVLILARGPWLGILAGAILTAIIQSSSATSGLAVLLVQQGILQAHEAIPIVVGANVGTTTTALLASVSLSGAAKWAAIANTVFNVCGVLVLAPFLGSYSAWVSSITPGPGFAVALAHTSFNAGLAVVFLIVCGIMRPWLESRFPMPVPTAVGAPVAPS